MQLLKFWYTSLDKISFSIDKFNPVNKVENENILVVFLKFWKLTNWNNWNNLTRRINWKKKIYESLKPVYI